MVFAGKFRPADGGDGGNGGNVIFQATTNKKSLAGITQLLKAESGTHGSRQKLHGRKGKDKIVLVPTGTVVYKYIGEETDTQEDNIEEEAPPDWLESWRKPWVGAQDYTSDSEDDNDDAFSINMNAKTRTQSEVECPPGYRIVADLIQDGDQVIAAAGGTGGRGNASQRALPHRPAPSTTDPPTPGENAKILLQMKLLADIAFVGLPNAGKSSLLRSLTRATPRVADYTFTTLKPQLGTVEMAPDATFVIADVPGLIEGASQNRGLGHRFLKHIERVKALAFVVDASSGLSSSSSSSSSLSTEADFDDSSDGKKTRKTKHLKATSHVELLRSEIEAYSPKLTQRPWIVVANKIDLLKTPSRTLKSIEKKCKELGALAVVPVSATGGAKYNEQPQKIGELKEILYELHQYYYHEEGNRGGDKE